MKEISFYENSGSGYLEEFVLLILQFVWHAGCIWVYGEKEKMLDYLGQLSVVLFVAGVILMLFKLVFNLLAVTNDWVWLGGLGFSALVMISLLYRRCNILGSSNHVLVA